MADVIEITERVRRLVLSSGKPAPGWKKGRCYWCERYYMFVIPEGRMFVNSLKPDIRTIVAQPKPGLGHTARSTNGQLDTLLTYLCDVMVLDDVANA